MNTSLTRLSNSALLDQLMLLVQREREATAMLVAHLAEVKRRKLYLGEGYGSMFRYCTRALHLSEHAAYLRLEAARMVLCFPSILSALETGELNLTSIRLLAPHLTAENLEELVAAARHCTRAEVEAFLARKFPRPDVPALVRKLPVKRAEMEPAGGEAAERIESAKMAPGASAGAAASAGAGAGTARGSDEGSRTGPSAEEQRVVIAPLSPERYKVQFTATASTHANLRRAQDLLRHRIPSGDLSRIFDLALTALVEKIEKEKFAATDQPRPGRGSGAHSRNIPADVKRAVWKRDGGRCAFIGEGGHLCSEAGFLEFHHLVPFARGGVATTSNIQLRCRAHNQYEATLEFGARTDIVRESRTQREMTSYESRACRGVSKPWRPVPNSV